MISFQFVLNFSGKKFYALSQSWMSLKLLCFYFKGLPLFLFLKARLWKCSAGYTWVLGLEGQPSCVTKGALSLFPNPWGPFGGTVSALLPHLWEAEPCLAEPHGCTWVSQQSQGKWPKLLCPTHLQPLWLHSVVPALLAWFKASGWRKVCTAFPLHLLFRFSGLKPAEQHILCHSASPLWVSSFQQVSKAAASIHAGCLPVRRWMTPMADEWKVSCMFLKMPPQHKPFPT